MRPPLQVQLRNYGDDIADQEARGTFSSPPDLRPTGAEPERRHGPRSLLAAAALALFVILAAAGLGLARRDPVTTPPAATTVPSAPVPLVQIEPGGGRACTPANFCVEVSGETPYLKFRLTKDGETLSSFDTDACSLASMSQVLNIGGGKTDSTGAATVLTGTGPADVDMVQMPGVQIDQLKVGYEDAVVHAFYATSGSAISRELLAKYFARLHGEARSLPPSCGTPLVPGTPNGS